MNWLIGNSFNWHLLCEGVGEGVGVEFGVWKGVWRQGWGGVQAFMFRLGSIVKPPYKFFKYLHQAIFKAEYQNIQ